MTPKTSVDNTALGGIRVIDASNLIAGPIAGTILADFGAEVIKIEHPEYGDPLRNHGASVDGVPLWWTSLGRNKRAITLNLSSQKGQAIFRMLIREADVVIESFRPGTFERWGLGYEELASITPDLIMARVTGFGQRGPLANRPGFGTLGEAMSGFAYRNGQPDGPPTLPPLGLADVSTGIIAATAILTALFARERGHGGQVIDLAIIESLLTMMSPQEIVYDQLGEVLERTGSRSPMNAPRNVYQTADGAWIAISASTNSTADRLMRLIGRDDIADQDWFKSAYTRVQHVEEVDSAVAEWVATKSKDEVLDACDDVGAPASPLYSAKDILEDPQYRALDSITSVEHPKLGQVRVPNVLFRLSKTPGSVRWPGPAMGEHNQEVYTELGLTEDDLVKLEEEGAI